MKTHYIGHSTLLIETRDHKLLLDPWLSGSVYCDQWHLFPDPINSALASAADVILVTHGHEDHLHHDSIKTLNKKARFFYPYQWLGGIREYLTELGYQNISEALTLKPYTLSDGTIITYVANALDSIVVIESEGRVLININDALPANHLNIIRQFTGILRKKWPKIDYLFCGYGSAAYFPNTVHAEGKDDLEIAQVREQMFAHNFCTIVEDLRPAMVIPFAADYVLLNESRQWINHVKLSKHDIAEYYKDNFKQFPARFLVMHSGDIIEDDQFIQQSPYHAEEINGRLEHLLSTQLAESEKRVNRKETITELEVQTLLDNMKANIQFRMPLFSEEVLNKIKYTIIVQDVAGANHFFVDCSGTELRIERMDHTSPDAILTIETTSRILNYCFASDWGGDAIVIGYGAEIHILDKSIIQKSLDIVCVRLLTRQPVASKHMKRNPGRAIKYLATNPMTTSWAVKQFVEGRNKVNKNPVNERDLWLSKTKCEICQVCNIPYMNEEFAKSI